MIDKGRGSCTCRLNYWRFISELASLRLLPFKRHKWWWMFSLSFLNVCLDFFEFFELFFVFLVHHNSSSFEMSTHTVMSLGHSTYAILLRRWRSTIIVCMAMLQWSFLSFIIWGRHQSHSSCPPLLENFLLDFTLTDTFLVKWKELPHLKVLLVLKSVICGIELSCTSQHQLLSEIKCVYVCLHGHLGRREVCEWWMILSERLFISRLLRWIRVNIAMVVLMIRHCWGSLRIATVTCMKRRDVSA